MEVPAQCNVPKMKSLFIIGGAAGGVQLDGHPAIWGTELSEQFGDGLDQANPSGVHVVSEVADATWFDAIAYSWALRADGSAFSWGVVVPPAGTNFPLMRLTPEPYDGLPPDTVAMRGNAFACALSSTGDLRIWGVNKSGAMGNGTTEDRIGSYPPEPVLRNVVQMPQCYWTNCVPTQDGKVYCWGAGKLSELGDGSRGTLDPSPHTPLQLTPKEVEGLSDVVGLNHLSGVGVCAWDKPGKVYCWGFGLPPIPQLPSVWPVTRPALVTGVVHAVDVVMSEEHIAILLRDGTLWTGGSGARTGRPDWYLSDDLAPVVFDPANRL